MKHASKDILLKHKKGRILYFDLKNKQYGVFAEDLAYPNGIVFDKKNKSLIVAEMTHYKLTQIPI
jgi:sugar lactone lactonase YvrE